jgi:hypothetical protein
MKIIFLDIDGVLNSTKYMISLKGNFNCVDKIYQLDPEAIAKLNRLTDTTGAFIVVSSTWRMGFIHNRAGLRGLFAKAKITGKVLDITPVNNQIRGAQIAEWIDTYNRYHINNPVTDFVILDDDSDMGKLKKHLIQTSHSDGLQDHHVDLAIAALNKVNG